MDIMNYVTGTGIPRTAAVRESRKGTGISSIIIQLSEGDGNLKKVFQHLCLVALLACVPAAAACSETKKDEGPTALSLMEEVNSTNILHPDNQCRLWYTISLPEFMGTSMDTEAKGLANAALYMDYFSDGVVDSLDSDLNMNGLYIKNLVSLNENGHPGLLNAINPAVADEDVLRRFCTAAKAKDVAVMMDLNVTAIDKDSEQFQNDLKTIQNAYKDDKSISEIDGSLSSEYWIDRKQHSDQWHEIPDTKWYYYGADGSEDPMLKPNSEQAKQRVKDAITWYMGLGISGFYLHDVDDAITSPDTLKEYLNWFDSTARELNENVVVIADGSSSSDALRGSSAYLVDQGVEGNDGAIEQAVSGALSPVDLGKALTSRSTNTDRHTVNRLSLNESAAGLNADLTAPQKKMALALNLLLPGQTFVFAGDELGIQASQEDPVYTSLATPDIEGKGNDDAEAVNVEGDNALVQTKDGNSTLNFVKQAILLRDSYTAISSGSVSVREDLSTDKILVLEEVNDSSHVLLAFNLSDSPASLDLSDVQIQDLPAELGGMLLTSAEAVTLEENSLYLPACSVALLK